MNTPSPLLSLAAEIRDNCNECGACVRNCAFLTQYGTPRSIAATYNFSDPGEREIIYQCSLCGLCIALCPEGLDPCALFLAIRRHHVEAGSFVVGPYRPILLYEALGRSRAFSWYYLPEGCETVFFPGCTLPGTRATVTWRLYRQLRKAVPSLGMVLACCAKPSHDLGRTAHFQQVFGKVLARLTAGGVRTVLTACPSCTRIFSQYGGGMSVQTVYEVLSRQGETAPVAAGGGEVSVHDPCPLRDHREAQAAVRGLLTGSGYTHVEMRHHKQTTLCCGEGGPVVCIQPRFSREWSDRRRQEAGGRRLVTYCAGCAGFLGRVMPTVHLLDLLFRSDTGPDDDFPVSKGVMTYFNRLLLKLRLMVRSLWR